MRHNYTNSPLIYCAGPYGASTCAEIDLNVGKALRSGQEVLSCGGIAVVPHVLSIGMELCCDETQWYQITEAVMCRCDAVYQYSDRVSRGVRQEILTARERQIPVFRSLSDVARYCDQHNQHKGQTA